MVHPVRFRPAFLIYYEDIKLESEGPFGLRTNQLLDITSAQSRDTGQLEAIIWGRGAKTGDTMTHFLVGEVGKSTKESSMWRLWLKMQYLTLGEAEASRFSLRSESRMRSCRDRERDLGSDRTGRPTTVGSNFNRRLGTQDKTMTTGLISFVSCFEVSGCHVAFQIRYEPRRWST